MEVHSQKNGDEAEKTDRRDDMCEYKISENKESAYSKSDVKRQELLHRRIVSFCFIVVIINLGVSTYIMVRYENPDRPKQEEFCVPCVSLIQGPFLEDNRKLFTLKMTTRDLKTANCCATTAEQVAIIFDLVYRKKRKQDFLEDLIRKDANQTKNSAQLSTMSVGRRSGIFAHVCIGQQYYTSRSGFDRAYVINNWIIDKDENPIAQIQNVTLKDGRFLIRESGLYFTYSQVYFVLDRPHESEGSKTKVLIHSLKRYNAIYPNDGQQELVRSKETKCWTDSDIVDHTSYTSTMVWMNTGDEVFVTVSDISLVSRNPPSTYFGIVKM